MTCTFFGHRDCPSTVKPKLRETIVGLIEFYGVTMFYVGNHGAFDALVRAVLRELASSYPHVHYAVVLAYMPSKRSNDDSCDYSDTMLPEGIETIPKRFAINWRNQWMLTRSDYVVTYVINRVGGAARFAKLARRQHKYVINII